jgi:hypothetical protein
MAPDPSSPTPSPAPSATPARPARRRRWKLFSCLFLLLCLGCVALYVWAALRWSYSDGERAGFVQKFSRKGWICKTWEGELAMATLPGTMPQVFAFTVRDPGTASLIEKSMGRRVSLHYEQHMGLPTSCFGETQYFVTQVQPVPGP